MTNSTNTTTNATLIRFVAATEVVNADIDVLLQDVREGKLSLPDVMDEALDHREIIYVVDASIETAKEAAAAMNELYAAEAKKVSDAQAQQKKTAIQKEEKKVANPKEVVDAAFEQKEAEKKESVLKTEQAKAFMMKHGAAIQNAKKAPEKETKTTKGETTMTNTNTQVRMGQVTEEKAAVKEEKVVTPEQKSTPARRALSTTDEAPVAKEEAAPARRRLSTEATDTTATGNNAPAARATMGNGRLVRTESIRQQFVKHEGPWYLNADLYPALNRFESILETMSDAELGIQNIVLVDPNQLSRYDRKLDVTVVIQVMSNGAVLEFPIKANKSQQSKSDLSSTSIGWVPTKNGMRPAFGFYRSNFPNVTATCSCGKKMENVSASNLYCRECKTRHNDAQVSINHAVLGLEVEEFTFQTIPNMEVPNDLLALVMAVAQYDAELPMHGVIEE